MPWYEQKLEYFLVRNRPKRLTGWLTGTGGTGQPDFRRYPSTLMAKKFAGPWPIGVLENKFWLILVNPPYPPVRPWGLKLLGSISVLAFLKRSSSSSTKASKLRSKKYEKRCEIQGIRLPKIHPKPIENQLKIGVPKKFGFFYFFEWLFFLSWIFDF